MSAAIDEWHRILKDRDFDALDALLADDVVFHSPVVHTPQKGREVTKLYLSAAFNVFPGDDGSKPGGESGQFRYVREVIGERDAVLEFVTEIDGIIVNGVDMICWNADDQIIDFKVMVRPLKAINTIHGLMARMLEKLKSA